MSFETMISSTLMALFQMTRLQQQQSLIIILPLNVFQTSLLYSLQSCTLCTLLLIGWRRQMMMKGILSFSQIQSLLFRPFWAKTGHILLSSTYWNVSIVCRLRATKMTSYTVKLSHLLSQRTFVIISFFCR